MVARDDNSTSTRLLSLLDEVNLIQPFPPIRRPQLLSEIVVADTSRVYHRAGREDVLSMPWLDQSRETHDREYSTHSSPTRSVLGCSSSDVRDRIVFYDLLVATVNQSSVNLQSF